MNFGAKELTQAKQALCNIRSSIVSKLRELAINFYSDNSSSCSLDITSFKVIAKFDGEFTPFAVKGLAYIYKEDAGYVPAVGAVACNKKGKEINPDEAIHLFIEMQDLSVDDLLKILKASLKAANSPLNLYKELSARLKDVRTQLINKLDSMTEICDGTIYFPPFRSMKKMKNGFFEERTGHLQTSVA